MENYYGQPCNCCGIMLTERDEVIVCPACRKPHHVSCWIEQQGCATEGCQEQNPILRKQAEQKKMQRLQEERRAWEQEQLRNQQAGKKRKEKKKVGLILGLLVLLGLVAAAIIFLPKILNKGDSSAPSEASGETEARIESSSDALEETADNQKKTPLEIAKEAYYYLVTASEQAETFGGDTYTAWNDGIHDADESGYDLTKLAKNLDLSVEDLKLGFAYGSNKDKWESMTEAEKNKEAEEANTMFKLLLLMSDSQFSTCVSVVTAAYEVTGRTAEIKKNLDSARDLIRILNEKHPDYELNGKLRDFYTKIQVYYDYCMNPQGSFKELQNIIQTFRQDVRNAKNELSFDLE
ncbi:MAG: hypothetical protein IJR95_07315 [Lachnospiraceae bacterium]|nr:hypothetical protein [Lachnospiraceae bacterium]